MRAAVAATAILGVVGLRAATQAFTATPFASSSSRPGGRLSSAHMAGHAEGAAQLSSPSIGLWCVCGLAAAAAASAKGRQSSAKVRGSVAVKVGKAANLVSERLEQAFKMSAEIQKSMAEVEGRNQLIMQKLEAARAKVSKLEAERDSLKSQLLGLVDQVDTALMGPLKTSTAMATKLSALKESASTTSSSAKVQSLETERDALKAQLNDLVGQIDEALLGPLKSSAEMVVDLGAMKYAAGVSAAATPAAAGSSASATQVVTSYPRPKSKKGAKKGKTFFPLPYPDFSIGQCYQY